MYKDHPDTLLLNGERSHKAKFRFKNPYDLHTRFTEISSKSDLKQEERKKIINMYERKPYLKKIKGSKDFREPNWGRFSDAIDDYVKFFCSIALDREVWCRVETYEGGEDNKMQTQWSDLITEAFHKYCIKPWHKKDQDVISAISDDCFFNRGCLYWKNPIDCYPCHIPAEDVFPDTNATTDLDSFDLLFIREKLSAQQLYEIASDPTSSDSGWQSAAILKALVNSLDTLKDIGTGDVLERFRRGGIPQSQQDLLIPIIYCYVREYHHAPEDHDRAGNCISLMVIPENLIAMGVDTNSVTEKPNSGRKDYLQFVDYYAKDFKEVLSLWTSNIKRGFYNSASFASQIYLGCRFYDQTMNSIIRAIRRSMRLFLKTGSVDTKKRVSLSDPESEVDLIGPDDEITQIGIKQDVTAATELLRTVSASINSFSPAEFQGTQNSPKGYPITKGEAQILSNQLDDSKSMSLKLFVSKNREFCCELYRRFINSTDDSDTYENLKRFKKEMKRKGVPPEAYDYYSVELYSRFNQFAGRASSNYVASNALLQATQIKPASVAEERAKRNVIAAVSGESNVSEYLDEAMQFEGELFHIGQENIALDSPFSGDANIPVSPSDNHMVHIQGHLSDYVIKLQMGNQLVQQAAQDQTYRRQFLIEFVANMINAQDIKGAHMEAHFAILAKDESKKEGLMALSQQFKTAQGEQDSLAEKVRQLQQQEVQQEGNRSRLDLEFEHDKRMKDQEFQFAKAMDQVKMEKVTSQTVAAQQKTSQNQQLKTQGKLQDQELKVADKKIDISSKAALKRIDITSKAAEASIKKKKDEQEAASKASSS